MRRIIFIFLLLSLISCASNSENPPISDKNDGGNTDQVGSNLENDNINKSLNINYLTSVEGTDLFRGNDDTVEIYFFDMDNINYGKTYKNYDHQIATSAKTCDSYMIKVGSTEVLVDGGFQMPFNASDSRINATYWDVININSRENFLRKVSALATDGVIEYLIVTHGDFDHISSLVAGNGLFASVMADPEYSRFVPIYLEKNSQNIANTKSLVKIGTIIDFNSNLVREYSDTNLKASENNKFLNFEPGYALNVYMNQVNYLISMGTKYVPAATLFDSEQISLDEKNIACTYTQGLEYIRYPELDKKYSLDEIGGKLVTCKSSNPNYEIDTRHYYEIDLGNGVKLNILYNWFYDHWKQSSVNSQDRNNISVCFQVVCDNFKFVGFGDLGGNGEKAILQYYEGTDVLENTTCFKLSHHGSTNNGENSAQLFSKLNSKIYVATGVAFTNVNKSNVGKQTDLALGALVNWGAKVEGNVKVNQLLMSNLNNGKYKTDGTDEFIFLCTNTIGTHEIELDGKIKEFCEVAPFHGDIFIGYSFGKVNIGTSYSGEINSYFTQEEFYTRESSKILSLQDTVWYNDRNNGFLGGE